MLKPKKKFKFYPNPSVDGVQHVFLKEKLKPLKMNIKGKFLYIPQMNEKDIQIALYKLKNFPESFDNIPMYIEALYIQKDYLENYKKDEKIYKEQNEIKNCTIRLECVCLITCLNLLDAKLKEGAYEFIKELEKV